MKILVLGAGGIGGYFGARLLEAGADLTFLVRPRRRGLLEETGLRIETPQGGFTVRPRLVTVDDIAGEFDLVIVAAKSYDLDDALAAIARVPGEPILLPFLNGIDHLAEMDRRFGRPRVMGGVAHIAATITPSGAIRQLTEMHSLTVGHRDPAHEALAREFAALCARAAFDSRYAENIEQVLWDKWTFLATLAGMTTACRASIGEIVAAPYGRELVGAMYAECLAVAAKSGFPVGEDASAKALGLLTQAGSSFTASMLRDLESGQRTEYPHILGALIERAEALGSPAPLLKLAHTHMDIHDRQRRPGARP